MIEVCLTNCLNLCVPGTLVRSISLKDPRIGVVIKTPTSPIEHGSVHVLWAVETNSQVLTIVKAIQ